MKRLVITPPQGCDETDALDAPALPVATNSDFRCPVCGDLINVASPEEILLHHEHVTHPDRFHFTKQAA